MTDIDRELLLQTFLADAGEHLDELEKSVVALESAPDDDELVNTIFRVAHTVKGDAMMVGFQATAEFAHHLEDLLDRIRDRVVTVSAPLISVLLEGVDTLRALLNAAAAGRDEMRAADRELMERLSAMRAGPAELAVETAERAESLSSDAAQPARRTLRVDVEKLDRMLNLAGEVAIARGRLAALLDAGTPDALRDALELHLEMDRLHADLQEQLMKARMVPVGPLFRQFTRTVRDLAGTLGKSARLTLSGEDVEMDTSIIEQLRDPLTHMIRNALDHGVETAELRAALGKDPTGTISLHARHAGGSIVIELADDGAGLDRTKIAARARALGITNPDRLGERELHNLVFAPGFSTADEVTDVSGRGVGMDVVRRNVEALRGSVEILTRAGEGTTFVVRVPLTLAIIDGFGIGVGDDTYVLPLDAVVECLELPAEARSHDRATGVINLRGSPLPYLRLRHHFTLGGEPGDRENVVVIQHGAVRAGIAVDRLFGESQTVIKPLGGPFAQPAGLAGSAILGSGRVALVLDVPALLDEVLTAAGDAPAAN